MNQYWVAVANRAIRRWNQDRQEKYICEGIWMVGPYTLVVR